MTLRTIVEFPHPLLKQRCEEVVDFDAELATLLNDMRETMVEAEGLGIAANQVAVGLRVFTMVVPGDGEDEVDETSEIVELCNPRIVGRRGEIRFEEGCLSFPGINEAVLRSAEVDAVFQDRDGIEHRRSFTDVAAVCIQHELDHLDGVTFLDRLSPLKRRLAQRSFKRMQDARRFDDIEDQRAAVRSAR